MLAIIPDRTRDDNTPALFPLVSAILAEKHAARLDALVALGTHPAMSDAQKQQADALFRRRSRTRAKGH